MQIPMVHGNGTGKKALMQGYESASEALRLAIDILCQAAPNARDYYVQEGDAFEEACKEHFDRVEKVREVMDAINEIWDKVAAQK